MRIRRASPLLLLLNPSLIAADALKSTSDSVEVLSNDEIIALNHPPRSAADRKPTEPPASSSLAYNGKPATAQRPYKGTEDAPVDGLDGKPHAGPFVDRIPDEARPRPGESASTTLKALPTSLENFKPGELADIPEKNDGVMNDENRPLPKKGTTGTEGGITEKSKARKGQDGLYENKPQEPKTAPVKSQSADDEDVDTSEKTTSKSSTKSPKSSISSSKTTSKEGKDATTGEKPEASSRDKDEEFGEGGYGMEKPTNLPEKPHNIPHPEPKFAKDDMGPPVDIGGGRDEWLVDTMPDTEGKTGGRGKKTQQTQQTLQSDTATPSPSVSHSDDHETWHELFHSFVLSFAMIIFSEIGDKTFLIAALMAMRHARLLVFSAALSALIAMTVLSAVLGHAFPTLLPRKLTTFAAAILFFVFGAKSLREGLAMPKDAGIGDEMREVEAELEEKEHSMRRESSGHHLSPYELESGRGRTPAFDKMGKPEPSPPLSRSPSPRRGGAAQFAGLMNLCSLMLSPAWVQTFVMTFLGEWGDRSQIATIAMAAGQDYWWVTLGAVVGHACCTGMAVLGGRALAGRVSMRVVTIGGAIAFLVFGVIYLFECLAE